MMSLQVETSAERSASSFATKETSFERETILLVEDEAFVRDVTVEILRAAGYRVLTAKNAAEATGLYEASGGSVELLLTDVILPGETGRALAERLRKRNPELKVLLVTGYAEQIAVLEQMHEECLAKPFSSDVLLGRVRQALIKGSLVETKESHRSKLHRKSA